MYRKILKFNEYCLLKETIESNDDNIDLKVRKDPDTGEKVVDKKVVSKEAQIRVLAKRLYKQTIDIGRFQTKMQEKSVDLQNKGADDNAIQAFQELLNNQMMALQTAQMDTENQMNMIAGASPGLSELAQRLSGEAKILADKKNRKWFDKKVEDFEKEVEDMKKKREKKKEQSIDRKGGKKDDDEK